MRLRLIAALAASAALAGAPAMAQHMGGGHAGGGHMGGFHGDGFHGGGFHGGWHGGGWHGGWGGRPWGWGWGPGWGWGFGLGLWASPLYWDGPWSYGGYDLSTGWVPDADAAGGPPPNPCPGWVWNPSKGAYDPIQIPCGAGSDAGPPPANP
ncbi:MAG: hypothetical protein ABSD80_07275 [Caulobacteraceae bacterium]